MTDKFYTDLRDGTVNPMLRRLGVVGTLYRPQMRFNPETLEDEIVSYTHFGGLLYIRLARLPADISGLPQRLRDFRFAEADDTFLLQAVEGRAPALGDRFQLVRYTNDRARVVGIETTQPAMIPVLHIVGLTGVHYELFPQSEIDEIEAYAARERAEDLAADAMPP